MTAPTPRAGLGWARQRVTATAMLVVVAIIAALVPAHAGASEAAQPDGATGDTSAVAVIVRETAPETAIAEDLVVALGGEVEAQLGIIGGFVAVAPRNALGTLASSASILSITEDGSVETQRAGWQDASSLGNYDPSNYMGSMLHTGYGIGVDQYWSRGYAGDGIGVALIDTGVAPVEGLDAPGKIYDGADLSLDTAVSDVRSLDANGHGTHLAGIIAGRDAAAPSQLGVRDGELFFLGVAPDAHIINVKVGAYDGAVDVSQVIAAIDWVVEHKDDPGLNIRVLNLSFGTDATQDPLLDPLSYAVEQAWHAGIFVVVASGNDGNSAPVRNPATNPYVFTVGASDRTSERGKDAQPIPDWSSCGVGRGVDAVAPGASIVSLRNPGSFADRHHASAQIEDRFFLGSGTSQAAAVAAGAAALVLDREPTYTPDEVKDVLMSGADPYKKVDDVCQGSGMINLHNTWYQQPGNVQAHQLSTGLGTLEGARGSDHLEIDGVVLEGEIDVTGSEWDSATWVRLAESLEGTWSGGSWSGGSWSGGSWSGGSWSGGSWSGGSWSGGSWSGGSWSGGSWSGGSWSGGSWSGGSWSGGGWQ